MAYETFLKICSKCKIEKPINMFSIANSKTGLLRGDCKECRKLYNSSRYNNNKEKHSVYNKEWFIKNREKRVNQIKEYKQNNKEKVNLYNKNWRRKNPDKVSQYCKKWYYKNLDKASIKKERRRCAENQAKVPWLSLNDLQCIREIYKKARYYTKLTGKLFVVDHIIPLRGKNVSGLHVPSNLRIMLSTENLIKGNSFENIGVTY